MQSYPPACVYVCVCSCVPVCLDIIVWCFMRYYYTMMGNASLICWQSFFFCLILYNRFNVISLLSWNAINEGLPTSSTKSQSQHIRGHFELFCQTKASSPYFLESCCAFPHTRFCVPVDLIYKRSIEICMRPMMPALKIHPNREYIDSFVIEVSLSFPCHRSRGSLSRLMYYQMHAALLPLFLLATYNLPTILTLLIAFFF